MKQIVFKPNIIRSIQEGSKKTTRTTSYKTILTYIQSLMNRKRHNRQETKLEVWETKYELHLNLLRRKNKNPNPVPGTSRKGFPRAHHIYTLELPIKTGTTLYYLYNQKVFDAVSHESASTKIVWLGYSLSL